MKNRDRRTLFAFVGIFVLVVPAATPVFAQEVDASKPTNFYPMLDNSGEFNKRDTGGNLVGFRASLTYPPNEAHLFLIELPLQYNRQSEKFGVGDMRVRYFFLPYKNYDQVVGAFGVSVDITAPTGSFANGLGSSAWSIAPGVTVGLMLADWIQTFPIVSYSLGTKPTTSLIADAQKRVTHGITIQSLTPVVLSDRFFVQITPIWSLGDVKRIETSRYIQEANAAFSLTPTLQLTGFWRGIFKDKNHTFRVGLTVFFVG